MQKYHLTQDGYNSFKKIIAKKTMLYILVGLVFIFVAISCDGGGGSNSLNSTRQFYSIDDVKTDGLEEILGKSVEFFVTVSDSCKLVVVENIGDFYDIVPIQIEGDPIRQGVYITKLETIENDNPYVSYESCDFLSRSGDMQVMRVPYLRLQESLIEKVIGFPQSETCDGYKNYIRSLSGNTVYISTSSSNNSTTTSNNTTSTQPTTYSWYEGPWETCVKGTQKRDVYCKSADGKIDNSYCTGEMSATSQNCINIELVLVNSGTFTMGSNNDSSNEEYAHTVNITNNFYVGKYEVTQGEWEAIMGNNPSGFQTCGAKCPVENVSWTQVQDFITKLNTKEGTTKYRLLTEAEWEYTANSGITTPSANIVDIAWYTSNSDNTTHEVGTKTANALGIYDMSGNVWEWVQDRYKSSYDSSSVDDPVNNDNTNYNVVARGGSYINSEDLCRITYRYPVYPGTQSNQIGFRIAKSL